ncbi:hypothetical protein [Microbulbifer thermotolerans]|uniref:Sulfotransferase family protein n=1 Tax=Microbulbifer thermotolerans TaxID=252514 RepID=A0AB35HY05_MICTH|nr:hypothetical protein [Microbulbifer thermotolerans]MCX2780127.1 hypothetical protein [Microbulbifer thermotolerans]MCX2802154.1 hypothetical protein [Microbulbifer thermotolerans]MCX2805551.1 hypothetical protein [Microbulbifer thermotolerans]MCX2831921.1 hypothetical protein [Microbulbifer thermotolerans]MCX2842514.1 hypothetical protein [Microbulbifer thermotolerans]
MISTNKNLIFTVTHGRTGTTFLTEVFKIFDDIRSLHEPEPNYANLFPTVKQTPEKAIAFLQSKIAIINEYPEKHYVETSNVFGKGFLIPLLRLGVMPGLLFLNRNFRKTASSLYERGSTPMRTQMGRHYSADPRFPGTLPIYEPENLTDYQLCYWGVLDAYARQIQAENIYKNENGKFYWVTTNDFHNFDKLMEIGDYFGLSLTDKKQAQERHKKIISLHHNPNKVKARSSTSVAFLEEEADVLNRVAFFDPLFTDKALSSPFIENEVKNRFY